MSASAEGDLDDYSAFFAECKELAYVLKHANQRALVLVSNRSAGWLLSRIQFAEQQQVDAQTQRQTPAPLTSSLCRELCRCSPPPEIDELGRSTGSLDGVGICWSAAESLLRRPACFSLLATHFVELSRLAALYPNADNCHLQVQTAGMAAGSAAGGRLVYLYRLADGPVSAALRQYGIQLAQMAAFPSGVIAEARQLQAQLQDFVSQQRERSASAGGQGQRAGGRGRAVEPSEFSTLVPSTLIAESPQPTRTTPLQVSQRIALCLQSERRCAKC